MSIPPVILPEQQFADANGKPYAGGSIASYVPATSTPKATWRDPGQTALNTQPVILDAAGRCVLYGDGEYRLVLRDAAGNQVWDIQATTLVSAAMAPVIAAPTLPDAVAALGVQALIDAEANARALGDSTEANARAAADNSEALTRGNADTALQANIDAEVTRATAAEAALVLVGGARYAHIAGGNLMQWGQGATVGGTGNATVTFPVPFPSACQSVQTTPFGNATNLVVRVSASSVTAFSVFIEDTNNSGGQDSQFYWAAFGL